MTRSRLGYSRRRSLRRRGQQDDTKGQSFGRVDGTPPSPESVNGWLRYATQHVAEFFRLELPRSHDRSPEDDDEPAVVLPDSGRMASITLFLPRHSRFQLPVAAGAKYEALTELKLWRATFFGAGRNLGDFVSSCCPRLHRLDIYFPKGLPLLRLRSQALLVLRLHSAEDLRILDVTAPNLRVFELEYCFGEDGGDGDEVVRIVAPRLQEIVVNQNLHSRRPVLDIYGLTSVRRLSQLTLNMHGQYYAPAMDVGFWLLEHCPSADHVEVWLEHSGVTEGVVDLMTSESEGVAHFANVRTMDMIVRAHEFPENHMVASISALLLRCPRLRSLDIWIPDRERNDIWWRRDRFCDELHPRTDDRAISLGLLEAVKISGFTEADEDMDLVSLLFASSNSIKRVILSSSSKGKSPGTVSLKRMMTEDDNNGTETVDQKLMSIPSVDRGRWHFGDSVYTWTCNAAER